MLSIKEKTRIIIPTNIISFNFDELWQEVKQPNRVDELMLASIDDYYNI